MGFGLATFAPPAMLAPSPMGGVVPVRRRSPGPIPMTAERRERLTREHRLTSSLQHAAVKESGTVLRGRHCLMLVLARPGEPTRFGFVASRKAVGGAVQRNRARRRLRELVRRRWPRLSEQGYWIVLVAFRGSLVAPHQELATEVEHLLARAGALSPTRSTGAIGHA